MAEGEFRRSEPGTLLLPEDDDDDEEDDVELDSEVTRARGEV